MQAQTNRLEVGSKDTDRVFSTKVLEDVLIDDNFLIGYAETMDLEEDEILNGGQNFVKSTEYESAGFIFIENTILNHLEDRIFREIHIPHKWKDEGVAEPNIAAKSKTKKICSYLYDNINIIPFKIVPNKEAGITVIYKNYNNARSLIIEVYNDLEMVGLVNDDKQKKLLTSKNITGFNFNELIRTYYEH